MQPAILKKEEKMADSQYVIRKRVPIPTINRYRSRNSKYPFEQMHPGDSFEVPVTDGKKVEKVRSAVYAATKKYVKETQGAVQFTTRILNDSVVGVWRVK